MAPKEFSSTSAAPALLKLSEVNEASTLIQSAAHEDANIIFGAVLDEKWKMTVKIAVIATGFREDWPGRRGRRVICGHSRKACAFPGTLCRVDTAPVTAKFMSEVAEHRAIAAPAPVYESKGLKISREEPSNAPSARPLFS